MYWGEIAALVTSVFWALTSLVFTMAGQRVGSQVVNRMRLLIASGMLMLVHWIALGVAYPLNVAPERWGWLAASALVGLVVGDGLLFQAYTLIGARLSMLLMALAPVFGAGLAWITLGETLSLAQICGILVTVAGIAWVIGERTTNGDATPSLSAAASPRAYTLGILCGLGGALGQAGGAVLSKYGLAGDFSPISASLMRVSSAAVMIWLISLVQGQARASFKAMAEDRRALGWTTLGATVGPVTGMTLSLVAFQWSAVGVASTLMALSPVILLPVAHFVFRERITWKAVFGTLAAIAGVAMLFLLKPQPLRTFEGARALAWVKAQCDLGPRITGSEASRQAVALFAQELTAQGWEVQEQPFTYMDTPASNLLAWRGEGDAVLIGAHFDSRRAADQEDPSQPVLGANDGASGAAVLLELARVLETESPGRRIYLAFFDAEDNGQLDGWNWIVGSTYMAEHWGANGESPLTAMVLVDMIGDADQQIYYEQNSNPALNAEIWGVAAQLGYGARFIPQAKYSILDDHWPFLRINVLAADLIDFDYPYWHTTQDTPDKVSAESLEAVGRTLEVWLEGE